MKISNYEFSGPYDINRGFVKKISAIYSIVDDKPKLLDVGQTDDLNNRFPNHPRQNCWESKNEGSIHLYILKENSEQNRLEIEQVIRKQYKPPCGER